MTEKNIVQMAKQRFDCELHTPEYAKIHADSTHLDNVLQMMDIRAHKRYVDIGTGNGYIAFELAKRFGDIWVTGVDIAENAIERDQQIAQQAHLKQIRFQAYQGTVLPLEDMSSYGIVSRYAFHHFPNPLVSAREMFRILEPGGFVVLADPVAYDEDTVGFIDKFQALKKDGHVCFYKQAELFRLFHQAGFTVEEQFFSEVTYPRQLTTAYYQLFEETPQAILERYRIDIRGNQVFITVKVGNTKFRKDGGRDDA